VASHILSGVASIGVNQLDFWTQELIRIFGEEQRCRFELADLGVIVKVMPPKVLSADSPKVIRLKERLLSLNRERQRIERDFEHVGARLLDWNTLEIVLEGGPEPGSWLSWQPGEPRIAWWRSSADPDSPRRLLPGFDLEDVRPVLH